MSHFWRLISQSLVHHRDSGYTSITPKGLKPHVWHPNWWCWMTFVPLSNLIRLPLRIDQMISSRAPGWIDRKFDDCLIQNQSTHTYRRIHIVINEVIYSIASSCNQFVHRCLHELVQVSMNPYSHKWIDRSIMQALYLSKQQQLMNGIIYLSMNEQMYQRQYRTMRESIDWKRNQQIIWRIIRLTMH